MVKITGLFKDKRFLFGLILGLFVMLFSFLGPLFVSHGEYEIFYMKNGTELASGDKLTEQFVKINALAKPSSNHPLGTDKEGRDILVRLMYGGQVSLLVALITIMLQGIFGTILGGIAGYFGKLTDELIMRFVDLINCIPDFPVILILSGITTKLEIDQKLKIYNLVILIAFFGAMRIARVVRGQVLSIKEQEFILSATAIGLSAYKKIVRHILPNVLPQIMILSALGVGAVILTESTLSFLGFGLPYPYASWGNMITSANDISILTKHLLVWVPAGILIFVTVLAFNLIGDALEDALNPKKMH